MINGFVISTAQAALTNANISAITWQGSPFTISLLPAKPVIEVSYLNLQVFRRGLLINMAIAVAYFVSGQLSLMFAAAEHYASVAFLPAGIGIMAVLTYGWRLGSTPILRTLQRSLIMGKRSVYVKEKKIQPRVQTWCC